MAGNKVSVSVDSTISTICSLPRVVVYLLTLGTLTATSSTARPNTMSLSLTSRLMNGPLLTTYTEIAPANKRLSFQPRVLHCSSKSSDPPCPRKVQIFRKFGTRLFPPQTLFMGKQTVFRSVRNHGVSRRVSFLPRQLRETHPRTTETLITLRFREKSRRTNSFPRTGACPACRGRVSKKFGGPGSFYAAIISSRIHRWWLGVHAGTCNRLAVHTRPSVCRLKRRKKARGQVATRLRQRSINVAVRR